MLKKNILISAIVAGALALGVASSASAAVAGPYLGGQIGWGDSGYHKDDFTGGAPDLAVNSFNNDGLAGRVFAGYQFNQNWAMELGYTRFHNTKISGTDIDIPGSSFSETIKDHVVDLTGKGILPLNGGLNLYGKAGLAYVHATSSAEASALGVSASGHGSANRILPVVGAGISYDLTSNVPVDLSYMRIQKVGGNRNIKSLDFIALGIAYNFGE